MAKSNAVWGIDIGNASLKALRCRPGEDASQIVADAFDYIEYPKILTQPGAEPAELVNEALKQFLSRNNVRGDRVAISVSGQNGLARFIKLPPVESKKIPDIVRYEARQQIPFDLNDVIWDYQRLGGGSEEEGFVLEAEIGLFAMKREQVHRALDPFQKAGIEVDFVQLTPLALYNYLVFDQLTDLPPADEYDPENPPPSVVVLSMGTDATDLVITNGYRVWQRSIPLGGNHFTKALTKELKLTFAKAEHLKRNAMSAQDPKAVFQAMRPVFNDLLTEIQRSIGYFTTIDRNAEIGRVVALGSGMKLPGLRRYLAQSLGYDVVRVESFRGLTGSEVVGTGAFKDNLISFGVAYGLALQGLSRGVLRTNLIPKEIVKDRIIREKKPWAVAAAAMLLMGMTLSFVSASRVLGTVDESRFGQAEQAAAQATSLSKNLQGQQSTLQGTFDKIKTTGSNLLSGVEGRIRWLELLKAINASLPRDLEGQEPEEIADRNQLQIVNIDCQKLDEASLQSWFGVMRDKGWYVAPGTPSLPPVSATTPTSTAVAQAPAAGAAATDAAASSDPGPTGEGYIVQIVGFHYHNKATPVPGYLQGAQYVRETLVRQLQTGFVELPRPVEAVAQAALPPGAVAADPAAAGAAAAAPAAPAAPADPAAAAAPAAGAAPPVAPVAAGPSGEEVVVPVTMKDLGISYAVLVDPRAGVVKEIARDPNVMRQQTPGAYGGYGMGMDSASYGAESSSSMMMSPMGAMGGVGPLGASGVPGAINPLEGVHELLRYDFQVQFIWQPKTPTQKAEEEKSEAAAASPDAATAAEGATS